MAWETGVAAVADPAVTPAEQWAVFSKHPHY